MSSRSDGFVSRYDSENSDQVDGLSGREGAFLACSFWLADDLHLIGRHDEAVELFEQLLSLRNDLGLLAEEYDPIAKRLVGNFPQAFSHVSLVNTTVGLLGVAHGFTHEHRLAGIEPALKRIGPACSRGAASRHPAILRTVSTRPGATAPIDRTHRIRRGCRAEPGALRSGGCASTQGGRA